MSMIRLLSVLAGPANILGQIVPTALPKAVDSFPTSPYDDPFEGLSDQAKKLQAALNAAVSKEVAHDGKGPFGLLAKMPFTIADVTTKTPQFPMGKTGGSDNNADLSYFMASEAKVAVMYAAYEMRAMARRFQASSRFKWWPQLARRGQIPITVMERFRGHSRTRCTNGWFR